MIPDLVFPAVEKGVEPSGVEDGIGIGEGYLEVVVSNLYRRLEKTLESACKGFREVLHSKKETLLVAKKQGGPAVFLYPGDIGYPLEPEEAGAGPEYFMGKEEKPCAGHHCAYCGRSDEWPYIPEGLFNKISGDAQKDDIGSRHGLFREGRYAGQRPFEDLSVRVCGFHPGAPAAGMAGQDAYLRPAGGEDSCADVAQGAAAAYADLCCRSCHVSLY